MSELLERGDQVVELLRKFYLEELDPEWVKNVIHTDFTEAIDLPTEFEDLHSSTNFFGLFSAILSSLRQYIDIIKPDSVSFQVEKRSSLSILSTSSICEEEFESKDVFSKFWTKVTRVANIKSIQAFLFYNICRGQRFDADEQKRDLGVHAASFYFLFLSIPGSNAFRVFHPILYLKALDILKLTTKLNVGASSPKKNRGSKSTHRKSSEDVLGEVNEDEDAEISYLSPSEASKLIRELNILLNDFLRLSNNFSLKHSPESLDETVAVMVEVTRCEIHNAHTVFLQRHSANSVTALTYNAYVALQSLCNPLHGSTKKTVILIMKYILYNILMMSRGSSDLSNRALGVIRDHTVVFVKYLMIQLGKESHQGIYILLQHLCLRVPDKADFREKTAKSLTEILISLPIKEYSHLLKWLFKFSHNEKAGHRLFTLEVISKLLAEDERVPDTSADNPLNSTIASTDRTSSTPSHDESFTAVSTDHNISVPANRHILSHKFLLCIIFSRCRDSAATVRSKALALLSECTLSNNEAIVTSMKQIFFNKEQVVLTTPHIDNNDINCESPVAELGKNMELPNAATVMGMLRRRALDDKVTVRKSALQVMENLMKLNEEMIVPEYLKVLLDHCRDPALFIRKQMIQSLTSLVEMYPSSETAIRSWVLGVLPLILDPEVKVQEKVVEYADQLIFRQMRPCKEASLTPEDELPWKILDAIIALSTHKFFNKILMMWSKSDYMRSKVISVAKSHVGGEFNEQTWTFLSLVSQYVDIKNPVFALDYFEETFLSGDLVGSYTLQQVLKVLSHSIKFLPLERASVLKKSLLSLLEDLSAPVELISPMVDTVTLITYTEQNEEEKIQEEIEEWAAPILKSCDEYLKRILFPTNPSSLDQREEEKFFRYLFTLGEVAQLCPSKVNKRMFLMMQSIIFHDNHTTSRGGEAPPRIPSTQTQSSQPPSLSFNPTRRLKTLAVITLGKMCLQHEDQAKRIIPAMGKMLDTTALPAMKINIIVVLSDMCVRYATLVDPLMPQVTACLRDPDIQVRRTTLTLLISLLQEDYLKLKGSFFYRILQCLCDEDDEVRSTVIFYMTERLLKRFPKIFLQHFIECIFHYNCYEEHESYNRFNQSRQEKELFSLSGAKYKEERMMLYRFMLDHMQDDQRFSTTQRLCQDVLGGVVDGRIRLTPSSLPMLEDTLMVLSSDEIKLAWLRSRPEDSDQPTDKAEQAEMAGIAIKKTIISQVVKRNVIENIIPILIALKHKLAENHSPLMKHLLLYFKEIMKDYKNEVKEILAGDKQLSKEIEFDLRKLEEQQQKEKERLEAENKQASAKHSLGNSPKLQKLLRVVVERNPSFETMQTNQKEKDGGKRGEEREEQCDGPSSGQSTSQGNTLEGEGNPIGEEECNRDPSRLCEGDAEEQEGNENVMGSNQNEESQSNSPEREGVPVEQEGQSRDPSELREGEAEGQEKEKNGLGRNQNEGSQSNSPDSEGDLEGQRSDPSGLSEVETEEQNEERDQNEDNADDPPVEMEWEASQEEDVNPANKTRSSENSASKSNTERDENESGNTNSNKSNVDFDDSSTNKEKRSKTTDRNSLQIPHETRKSKEANSASKDDPPVPRKKSLRKIFAKQKKGTAKNTQDTGVRDKPTNNNEKRSKNYEQEIRDVTGTSTMTKDETSKENEASSKDSAPVLRENQTKNLPPKTTTNRKEGSKSLEKRTEVFEQFIGTLMENQTNVSSTETVPVLPGVTSRAHNEVLDGAESGSDPAQRDRLLKEGDVQNLLHPSEAEKRTPSTRKRRDANMNVKNMRRTPAQVKENLMRAISTPNPSQKVINDITFINKTQEISGIEVNDSGFSYRELQKTGTQPGASHTLLLHFNSPEAFAKDDQFSRLRRSSKRSLSKVLKEQKAPAEQSPRPQELHKRPSGGFLESLNDMASSSDDGTTFLNLPSIKRSLRKSPAVKAKSTKRPSLDPTSHSSSKNTKKSKLRSNR